MCGIAGWFDKTNNLNKHKHIIDNMSLSLANRGPDENGIFMRKNLCLIHRRLSIIDIESGKQPMTKAYKGRICTIVYNGEIYNSPEIMSELRSKGFSFFGHSDTEVALTAYLCWGTKCVEKLNGIFAFAVWDDDEQKLFLARDRIGVKPLFYYEYENGLLFASEIKTLLKNPIVEPKIDEQGLYEVFLLGPARTSGFGVIKGIKELLPGECATYNGKEIRKQKYFTLRAYEHRDNEKQTIEHIRELITDSIERQLVSDVPLCTFLSGGLDSSIISYIASNYYRKNKLDTLTTYSVDYKDNEKYFQKSLFQPTPDSDFIDLISTAIGSEHRNVLIDNSELFDALYASTLARDLPGMTDVDSSLLLFCKAVKKDFKVALSGECADEIFGGYPWYHNKDILFEDTFPWSRSLDIRHSILKNGLLKNGDEYVRERYLATCQSAEKLDGESKLDSRMREMFKLNLDWFMQTLLDRKDRMSMYSGLEVRVPFCDYRIVEYAYNMPWELKSLNGREKGIVRKAFEGLLPDEIVWRKKSPYPKTHNPLYFKLAVSAVRKVLNDKSSPLYDIIDKNAIENIIENPESITSPWYGQLMKAPQILSYIIQTDFWLRTYNIQIEI